MKKIKSILLVLAMIITSNAVAREYHVSVNGNDKNDGTVSSPFLTISHASLFAQPGDEIVVHAGLYREKVTPPRGGESDSRRIVYRSAGDGKVEIKGSEIINGWTRFAENVWKVKIPNSFFGKYNPYKDLIHGDWFTDNLKRRPHTGEVYLNNKSLYETNLIEEVLNPRPIPASQDKEGSTYTWFCESDDSITYIYANFHNYDPNKEMVEINVRKSCFYPGQTGMNYITVSGFYMSQAATQWAPPTAEQIGLIGTNWSKGWIIENNVISNSKCSGITLGKYGDEFDNKSANTAEGYVGTVNRALANGWNKETIGHHIVRNNTIFNCEQTGICGSLGAVFSQIINNNIFDIWTKRLFSGAELAGIKIHASIDLLIKNNRLANTGRGIWMDWMAQGTRVTSNLCYGNTMDDIFFEVDHGPYLVDNNIFLSATSLRDWSQGGAFVHNIFAGRISTGPDGRTTPFHKPHSTEVLNLKNIVCGDNRFYNNIFIQGYGPVPAVDENKPAQRIWGYGPGAYKNYGLPMFVNRNVYYNGVKPFQGEMNFILREDFDPQLKIEEKDGSVYLSLKFEKLLKSLQTLMITTRLLGKAAITDQAFENPDGSPLSIDTDYFNAARNIKNPAAGPFENPVTGKPVKIKVW